MKKKKYIEMETLVTTVEFESVLCSLSDEEPKKIDWNVSVDSYVEEDVVDLYSE